MFYMSQRLDLQMDFRTAVELRMIQSVGMAFLFVPIQTIAYSGVPVQKNNQVSGIINLSRNLGGDIGIAFVTTLITRHAQTHQANLAAHATAYDAAYRNKLLAITRAFGHAGATSITAAREATGAMYRQLATQATQLAYLDALRALGIATALMIPVIWFAGRPQARGAPVAH
jgi:DHA2 family multidrug resistance protein